MILKSIRFSVLSLGLMTASGIALAASNAPAEPGVYFHPVQAWAVSAPNKNGSCAVSNHFNNGFGMTIGGANKEPRSIGIDFLQNIFKAGQSYDVTLGVPGGFSAKVPARAATASGLALNISGQGDFYGQLRDTSVLDVTVEGNSFRFYMTGFNGAAQSFDQCLSGKQADAGAAAPQTEKETQAAKANNPSTINESIALETQEKTGEKSNLKPAEKTAAALPLTEISPSHPEITVQKLAVTETTKLGTHDEVLKQADAAQEQQTTEQPAAAAPKEKRRMSEEIAEEMAKNPTLANPEATDAEILKASAAEQKAKAENAKTKVAMLSEPPFVHDGLASEVPAKSGLSKSAAEAEKKNAPERVNALKIPPAAMIEPEIKTETLAQNDAPAKMDSKTDGAVLDDAAIAADTADLKADTKTDAAEDAKLAKADFRADDPADLPAPKAAPAAVSATTNPDQTVIFNGKKVKLSDVQAVAKAQTAKTPAKTAITEAKAEPATLPLPGTTDKAAAPSETITPAKTQAAPETVAQAPEAEVTPPVAKKTPAMVIHKHTDKLTADFTKNETPNETPADIEPSSASPAPDAAIPAPAARQTDPDLIRKISELEASLAGAQKENAALSDELKSSLKESRDETVSISSDNWNLERATMRYTESERQSKMLGQQLQQERAQCAVEKQELEGQLFDPQVTSREQLAKLAELQQQLAAAQAKIHVLQGQPAAH